MIRSYYILKLYSFIINYATQNYEINRLVLIETKVVISEEKKYG